MRLGIDLGGSKIEIAALEGGREVLRRRLPTPRTYDETIAAIAYMVAECGIGGPIGIGIPGTETLDGLVKNANSTWLIGRPFRADLETALGRPVRLANDANCFALSEAADGAGAGARVVFGVIAGTGIGGGVVVDGKIIGGAHGVGGEWGHIPLPAPSVGELRDARHCYCGKRGCLEVWCSGPGLEAEFARMTGRMATAKEIAASDRSDERAVIAIHADRLARGLANICNILDPDVIVLGGGLSNMAHLYEVLPPLVEKYGFTLGGQPRIVKNKHGDSSGVRGAAWLWPET
ncbi:MAG: ROK family protein [Alphaproteobacteria bacterium]|nr:ROK family protein [Alphaproteobacteria bacterium]